MLTYLPRKLVAFIIGPITILAISCADLTQAAALASRAPSATLEQIQSSNKSITPAPVTADFYDRNGNIFHHFENDRVDSVAMKQMIKQMRPTPEELIQLREVAQKYASKSKRGKASVARALTILDALEAPTSAEFHLRVRSLGVSVDKVAILDESGQGGIQTTYSIEGKKKLRIFMARGINSLSSENTLHSMNAPMNTQQLSGPAVMMDEDITSPQECYVDGEPCATQEELDDAMMVACAYDDDTSALESEMNDVMNGIINEGTSFCGEYAAAGPFVRGSKFDLSDGSMLDKFNENAPRCWSEFLNFAGAALSTHGAIITLVAVILLATGPVSWLLVTGGLLVIAGGYIWTWSGGVALLDCARRMTVTTSVYPIPYIYSKAN
jgi:hypothetical protein